MALLSFIYCCSPCLCFFVLGSRSDKQYFVSFLALACWGRELVALLLLSSSCHVAVTVPYLFLCQDVVLISSTLCHF